jgi:hypothetical protein
MKLGASIGLVRMYFVRAHEPVAAREIGQHIGVSGNRLSVKLGRMVSAGLLTKTGERRGTRYSVS